MLFAQLFLNQQTSHNDQEVDTRMKVIIIDHEHRKREVVFKKSDTNKKGVDIILKCLVILFVSFFV